MARPSSCSVTTVRGLTGRRRPGSTVEEILTELGYGSTEIAGFRAAKII